MPFFLKENSMSMWEFFYQNFIHSYRDMLLEEVPLEDFRERHLFVARIRILIFILTWVMFFVFFPQIWSEAPFVPLAFNIGFLVTAYCYWNILRENHILYMVLLEVFADVMTQLTLIYILGFYSAVPYLFFCLYVAGTGILFSFHVALIAAVFASVGYIIAGLLIQFDILPVFSLLHTGEQVIHIHKWNPIFNMFFLPVSLGLVVYATLIANYFARQKQKTLQRRNVQLTALKNIGATIRRPLHTSEVIEQVLQAVTEGLLFEVAILALLDEETQELKFYVSKNNILAIQMQELLGEKMSKWRLPVYHDQNAISSSIQKNRVIIRNLFSELVLGIQPKVDLENAIYMQNHLGFKKFVITPLEAEQKGIGALIGASTSHFIESTVIDTLDNFANQAALAIESSQLFGTLREKNKELIQANKVKSEFLAIMSHELRTPLNAVIGFSEALQDEILGELNVDQKQSNSEILKNAKRLLELINNILDLAKLETDKLDLQKHKFKLIDLVTEVHDSLRPLFDKKSQTLKVIAEEGLPLIDADPIRMRQILVNLLGNANKFTDENGEITVTIHHYEDSSQVIEEHFKGLEIPALLKTTPVFYFSIKDNGIGIQPENLERIFVSFSQVDSSYTRHHEGTGLGLSLTRQLVSLHKGLITVESTYLEGSEFKILLPQEDKK